ncbi:MAG: hypothetical protein GY846_19220 [Deltaproteobacteria bacterium]|nr:hypothetical protein [Deltaproteobacteria bacterium]
MTHIEGRYRFCDTVTSPAATIINNAINVLSGGNAVVFSTYPASFTNERVDWQIECLSSVE